MKTTGSQNFVSYEGFAEHIVDHCFFDGMRSVGVVCFYEDAVALVQELIKTGNCILCNIDLQDYKICGYDKEFYITVQTTEYDELELWCEPAYQVEHDQYLLADFDIVYVMEDCSSRVLQKLNANQVIETYIHVEDYDLDEDYYNIEFDEDECCNECCCDEECCENCTAEVNMSSFTVSKTDEYCSYAISVYSTDKEFLKDMLERYDGAIID